LIYSNHLIERRLCESGPVNKGISGVFNQPEDIVKEFGKYINFEGEAKR